MIFPIPAFPVDADSNSTHRGISGAMCVVTFSKSFLQQVHTELQEQPPCVVWMESEAGKAGSCDTAGISVLGQTDALGRMEGQWLQHKPWTGQTIFD